MPSRRNHSTSFSTSRMTSGPMPSPGRRSSLWVAMAWVPYEMRRGVGGRARPCKPKGAGAAPSLPRALVDDALRLAEGALDGAGVDHRDRRGDADQVLDVAGQKLAL